MSKQSIVTCFDKEKNHWIAYVENKPETEAYGITEKLAVKNCVSLLVCGQVTAALTNVCSLKEKA